MTEIVIDSESALMTYYNDDFIVELIWKKDINSEEFHQIYEEGINFASNNKVHYFLSDIRNEGLVPIDDVRWLSKEVISKASELGIKKIALVNEDDRTFSTIYAESIKKKIENFSIQVNIFSDLTSARSWLTKKNY